MLGPFATASRRTPMSTTTTTTRDRGDRYGPIEWAQWNIWYDYKWLSVKSLTIVMNDVRESIKFTILLICGKVVVEH